MREIFDWKIVYEALSGVPLHYGVEVRDSVVICMMEVAGTRALLGTTLRIDAGVMVEPNVVLEILRQQASLGANGAVIAVIHPESESGIDHFFAELTRNWPLEYHAGYALQTEDAIAASCACGDDIQIGDALELCATTSAAECAGRDVWADERWFRAERTPAGKMSEKMTAILGEVPANQDTAELTALVLEKLERCRLSMTEKARIVAALGDIGFRDGFLSWATSRHAPPADFAHFFTGYGLPDRARLDDAIHLMQALCRWLPEGAAAAPLAAAAYLGWFSGNGLRARVLTEQAEEESPEYSLTVLVGRLLAAGAPPPWVPRRAESLVS